MDELATTSQGEKPRKTHYDVGLLFRKPQAKSSTLFTSSTFRKPDCFPWGFLAFYQPT